MNDQAFLNAYHDPGRSGVNEWAYNMFYPNLIYSDGVKQCAEAGLYWMLDIINTETVQAHSKYRHVLGTDAFVYLRVSGATAELSLTCDTGEAPVWAKHIALTDAPEGDWCFYLSNDGDGVCRLFLPTEY